MSSTASALPSPQIEISEVTHLLGRASPIERPRLNLLLPTLKEEHVFGGIMTALQFFLALAGQDEDARIILSDQGEYAQITVDLLRGWHVCDADTEDAGGRLIVPFASRGYRTLPVRRADVFVATAWWTAYVLQRLLPWQAQAYAQPPHSLVYLVQDHEPGFYPLSTRHVLAQSTYEYPQPMIGVFNTGLLRDFFEARGYRFSGRYAFEPQLNPVLADHHRRARSFAKRRQLILYGRPGVPRNAFELVCQGVRHWSAIDPAAELWRILSLGEPHGDIGLHHGLHIVSRGKLDLHEYARTLSESAIGVSLMLSPHPSYPPLEMAEFAVQTITNAFANKDLGILSPNIHSLRTVTPEAIGERIRDLAAPFAASDTTLVAPPTRSLFSPKGATFPFIPSLRAELGLPE